eukprot:TRINITY_DN83662_c0_g1_i1.p1 TRINITY_DN83662_c0_g1~~TRINITY_DN83662_c0_g1_i1.p1  ORF type:complete len:735 (+),score=120.92 TRINITY_DN83662_c0_g1_i1:85-2289(+)
MRPASMILQALLLCSCLAELCALHSPSHRDETLLKKDEGDFASAESFFERHARRHSSEIDEKLTQEKGRGGKRRLPQNALSGTVRFGSRVRKAAGCPVDVGTGGCIGASCEIQRPFALQPLLSAPVAYVQQRTSGEDASTAMLQRSGSRSSAAPAEIRAQPQQAGGSVGHQQRMHVDQHEAGNASHGYCKLPEKKCLLGELEQGFTLDECKARCMENGCSYFSRADGLADGARGVCFTSNTYAAGDSCGQTVFSMSADGDAMQEAKGSCLPKDSSAPQLFTVDQCADRCKESDCVYFARPALSGDGVPADCRTTATEQLEGECDQNVFELTDGACEEKAGTPDGWCQRPQPSCISDFFTAEFTLEGCEAACSRANCRYIGRPVNISDDAEGPCWMTVDGTPAPEFDCGFSIYTRNETGFAVVADAHCPMEDWIQAGFTAQQCADFAAGRGCALWSRSAEVASNEPGMCWCTITGQAEGTCEEICFEPDHGQCLEQHGGTTEVVWWPSAVGSKIRISPLSQLITCEKPVVVALVLNCPKLKDDVLQLHEMAMKNPDVQFVMVLRFLTAEDQPAQIFCNDIVGKYQTSGRDWCTADGGAALLKLASWLPAGSPIVVSQDLYKVPSTIWVGEGGTPYNQSAAGSCGYPEVPCDTDQCGRVWNGFGSDGTEPKDVALASSVLVYSSGCCLSESFLGNDAKWSQSPKLAEVQRAVEQAAEMTANTCSECMAACGVEAAA